MDLPYISGEGNFVMIRLPFSDTLAYRRLMRKGYMIRTMTGFRFPNHIRVTLHDVPVMEGFVDALRNTLA
jgi:histidinol-phosphate aminotransferase